MQWKLTLALAAFAAATGSPLMAQNPDGAAQEQAGRGRRMGNPAEWVLSQRDHLQLTPDQVQRLEQIRDKYKARDQPLTDQLRADAGDMAAQRDSMARLSPDQRRQAFEQRRARRQAFLEAHPEAAKAMKQLREDRRAARKEIRGVLTQAQRDQVRESMADRRDRGRRGRDRDSTSGS
jgi:hypothetical protein